MIRNSSTLATLLAVSLLTTSTGYGKNAAARDTAEAMFKHGPDQHSGSLA